MANVTMPEDDNVDDDAIDSILNEEDSDVEEILEAEDLPQEEEEAEEEIGTAIEDMADDAELWTGGPIIGQIKEWKEEYENVYVTSITYDKHVVWRTMNRAEYKAHMRNMEKLVESGQLSQTAATLYNEEAVAELCILFPRYDRKTSGKEMAGVPSIISQEVMEASGFTAIEVRQL